jgi:hypothetical protein
VHPFACVRQNLVFCVKMPMFVDCIRLDIDVYVNAYCTVNARRPPMAVSFGMLNHRYHPLPRRPAGIFVYGPASTCRLTMAKAPGIPTSVFAGVDSRGYLCPSVSYGCWPTCICSRGCHIRFGRISHNAKYLVHAEWDNWTTSATSVCNDAILSCTLNCDHSINFMTFSPFGMLEISMSLLEPYWYQTE